MTQEKPSAKKKLGPKAPEEAKAPKDEKAGYKDLGLPEPTRYGDWEKGGKCIDF